MMPSHVRIFWWLSVAIVAHWVVVNFWYLTSAHHLETLAKLQPEIRESARQADLQTTIIAVSAWGGLTLGTAWLAAFRQQNWARWAFASLFLLREAIPFLVAAYFHMVDDYLVRLAHQNWTDPLIYIDPALSIAAIGFVFSGNDWFRKPQDATSAWKR